MLLDPDPDPQLDPEQPNECESMRIQIHKTGNEYIGIT